MALDFKVNINELPLEALIIVAASKRKVKITVSDETCLYVNDNVQFTSNISSMRYLANTDDSNKWMGSNALERCEINHWITYSVGPLSSKNNFQEALEYLDRVIAPVTYLVGNQCTLADIVVWSKLFKLPKWIDILQSNTSPTNVTRWYTFIASLDFVKAALSQVGSLTNNFPAIPESNRKDEGKFVDLPGAEMGKVVVRFPPEASGYLHIGHAKAALLNQYYKEAFNGQLIMRFDDTNPAKEKEDFEKVILEDLKLLKVDYDKYSHTSDYFDLMLEMCEKLIKEGKAYVDDTNAEDMKKEREKKICSKNRDNSVEKNLSMWNEMKNGTEKGQMCCVRAKIDMSSLNGCMRDPTIYRCKNETHPRTGNKYKVYPTYDFACPIVDSLEGVTHCLRTMEYHDRDEQFYWFIDVLGLRKPHIWEYSRLNMTNTVLSKRKLTWFVENKYVKGWDDPRMPTVRGVLRRGMTVEGLRQFIIAQGSSRSVVLMEWDKIWAFNKKVIDPVAPRYTAVDSLKKIPVKVLDVNESSVKVAKHPKNPEVGEKTIWTAPKLLVDEVDAVEFKENENVTFINWGNLTIKKIVKENGRVVEVVAVPNLEDKNYKKTLKITWLADTDKAPLIPVVCLYFDHIISKAILGKDEDFKKYIDHTTMFKAEMLGEPELASVKKSDIIQLQRKGFFICDQPYEKSSVHTFATSPIVLIYIPDGHSKGLPSGLIPVENKIISQTYKNKDEKSQKAKDLLEKIACLGDEIRKLKAEKADKSIVGEKVKLLLQLKASFKEVTGEEWKPGIAIDKFNKKPESSTDSKTVKTSSEQFADSGALCSKISELSSVIQKMSLSDNISEAAIEEQMKLFRKLCADFKSLTGNDWKPDFTTPVAATSENKSNGDSQLSDKIKSQGDKVRQLKSEKAEKSIIDAEVKILLKLKSEFKSLTGKDWTPAMSEIKVEDKSKANTDSQLSDKIKSQGDKLNEEIASLTEKIKNQGNVVRTMKSNNTNKEQLNEAIQKLLSLKEEYKSKTGQDFPSEGKATDKKNKSESNKKEQIKSKPVKQEQAENESGLKKITRLGLEAKKEENLPEWYSQIIVKSELIEYYDISGCYILRPWSYAIWEAIKDFLDNKIKLMGVKNCYFPIFVSKAVLEKEKTHIADFAPEVAWVTKSGESDLAEPIAVRPTSETVMYPAYAKWIQSYRDLPIKLNQWNNVVRWEFKHPQPFLRTREFLWQEGHTAFATYEEAEAEVYTMLDNYAQVYTDLLAVPVVKGRKTEKEKFAGGDFTLTVEAYISASGRAIQGGTSHHLGQNFSKMFEIIFEDPVTQEKKFVYQNSWGLTTRTIGVLIMVHADNQGLVLPPRVASIQVVIVPCGITASLKKTDKDNLLEACNSTYNVLSKSNIRCELDDRENYSPGWKFNHWELKGVPIRMEIGPKDLEKNQVVVVRRDTGEKLTIPSEPTSLIKEIQSLLDKIQSDLLMKATNELKQHMIVCKDWNIFCQELDNKNILLSPFCGKTECEDKIKEDSARNDPDVDTNAPSMGAKSLCVPFDQPAQITSNDKCIHPICSAKPKYYCLFGRSY
ncbi:hypothetical protein O3M35_006955 [Rhynocoris fuscipes]|uniref:Bifunctional glutamate/proline--tRNA ligase n=1 Tax=Rhynocoris fuscipes TaxID=488301 RepID=A0AAW1DHS1_9HEMI